MLRELIEHGTDRREQTARQAIDVASALVQAVPPGLTKQDAQLIIGNKEPFQRAVKAAIRREVSRIRQEKWMERWIEIYKLFGVWHELQDFRPYDETDLEFNPSFAWMVVDDGRIELKQIIKKCRELNIGGNTAWADSAIGLWHRRGYINPTSFYRLVYFPSNHRMPSFIKECLVEGSQEGISLRELLLLLIMLKIGWRDDFFNKLPPALKRPILCLGSGYRGTDATPAIVIEENGLSLHPLNFHQGVSDEVLAKNATLRTYPQS